jgi:hypothetical protein
VKIEGESGVVFLHNRAGRFLDSFSANSLRNLRRRDGG